MDKPLKEPVKLRTKKLANGTQSLYLDIYINGKRYYEFLRLYLLPENSRSDKEKNRQTLKLAASVKAQRIIEVQNGRFGFDKKNTDIKFFDYYDNLCKQRLGKKSRSNWGNWLSARKHLQRYENNKNLLLSDITTKWVTGFRNYLDVKAYAFATENFKHSDRRPLSENSKQSYFNKLRACLNQAFEDGLLTNNPTKGVQSFKGQEVNRQYLTLEEVRKLAETECSHPEVKRAFLFSCLTGLRRSDVEKLTWSEVSTLGNHTRLTFRQTKTGGQEYVDIAPQAAELIGSKKNAKPDDKIFGHILYPSDTNNVLRVWAAKAGIDKHISFHTSRHTFATLLLTLGTDLYTVSKLLGHREIRTTQIYAKIIDAKKQEAIDNIPKIF